eukprot:1393310-Amorphochlora_amoeboformis.AAC.2
MSDMNETKGRRQAYKACMTKIRFDEAAIPGQHKISQHRQNFDCARATDAREAAIGRIVTRGVQHCWNGDILSATYWEHPPVLGGDEASERQRGHRSKLDPEFNWNFENIVSSENYMEREIHWEALPKPKVATLVRRFLCLDVDSGNDPNFPGNPRIPVNHDSPGNLIPKCRGPRGFDPSYAGSQTRLQGEVFGPILHGYHNIGVHFGHANRITRSHLITAKGFKVREEVLSICQFMTTRRRECPTSCLQGPSS